MSARLRRGLLLTSLGAAGCFWAALSMGYVRFDETGSLRPNLGPAAVASAGASNLQPSVEQRLANIDARFRLEPDRRALHAVVELERLLSAENAPAEGSLPAREFREGRWEIRVGERLVGTLPELPDFDDLLGLLDARVAAARTEGTAPELAANPGPRESSESEPSAFTDGAVFELLERLDARWGSQEATVADLRHAALALAQLSLFLSDELELADFVQGRALAALALARGFGRDEVARTECMLALALGYSAHARALESSLGASDPLLSYMRRDVERLRASVSSSSDGETRFFYGRALAAESRASDWTEWLRGLGPEALELPLLRTFADRTDLDLSRWLPELTVLRVQQVAGLPPLGAGDASGVFARLDLFEEQIEVYASAREGPFGTPALQRAFYRALVFDALARKVKYYDRALSSEPALRELARTLSASRDADVAVVAELCEILARLEVDSQTTSRGWKLFESPSILGPRQRLAVSYELLRAIPAASGESRDLADAAVAFLDSRPDHVALGVWFARRIYRDARQVQRLEETLAAHDPLRRDALHVQLAARRGNRDELWSLLADEALALGARLEILEEVRKLEPVDHERVERHYELEISRPSPLYSAFRDYSELLSEQGRHAEAQRVWRRFFDHPHEFRGIDQAYAVAKMAEQLRLDGKPERAWEWLEPALESYVGVVLSEATSVQVALGDLEHAEQIARRELERYPRSTAALGDLAEVLWQRGRFAEAARLFAGAPDADSHQTWHQLATSFTRIYGEVDGPEARQAFEALVSERLDYDFLQPTIDRLRDRGRPELAFELGNLIQDSARQILLYTQGYKSLALARGEDEALAWLRSVLPRSWIDKSPKLFYMGETYDLLWTLTTDPGSDEQGQMTWLLRTGAYLRQGASNAERRAALLEYYEDHDSTLTDRLGGALLGLRSGDELLSEARDETELCLVASFLGLRAETEGRLQDALRLYQLGFTTPSSDTVAFYEIPRALDRLMKGWGRAAGSARVARGGARAVARAYARTRSGAARASELEALVERWHLDVHVGEVLGQRLHRALLAVGQVYALR